MLQTPPQMLGSWTPRAGKMFDQIRVIATYLGYFSIAVLKHNWQFIGEGFHEFMVPEGQESTPITVGRCGCRQMWQLG